MIKKILKQNDNIQGIIEKLSQKDIIPLFYYLLKDKSMPLEKKYAFLSELIKRYSDIPTELYEIVLVKLFNFYETTEFYQLLNEYYNKTGKYKEMVQLMDYFSSLTTDDSLKSDIYAKLGYIYKDLLLDQTTSLMFFKKSLKINENNTTIAEEVEDILMKQENWELIVKNFEEKVETTEDLSARALICLSITKIHLEHSENIDKAKYYLKKAIEINPLNEEIPLLIKKAFIDSDEIDEITEVLMGLFQNAQNEELKKQYVSLLKELFKDIKVINKKGFSVYENLVLIDPTNREVFENAVNYAIENGKYKEMMTLAEKINKTGIPKEEQIFLTNFMVEFAFEYLNNIEEAEKYARISQRLDAEKFKYDYIYLEFFKSTGNTRKVIEILTKKLTETKEISEQINLHKEIAEISEVANLDIKVIDSYKAILKLDPENEEAKESLKRFYRQGQKWRPLMELLKTEIDYYEKKEGDYNSNIVILYEELIELSSSQLNQDTTMLYKKVLQYDPTNLNALNFLLDKSKVAGRWNEYIKILAQKLDAIEDETTKIDICFEIAEIYIKDLKKPLEASVYFEKVLEIDKSHGDALDRLKEIYTTAQKYDKLYFIHLKEVELSSSNDSKVEILTKLYSFLEAHLKNDLSKFQEVVNEIIKLDALNIFALSRKLVFAEKSQNVSEQKEVLLTLYNLDKNKEIVFKLAKILDTEETQLEAVNYYKEYIVEFDSKNENVINRLVEIYIKNSLFSEIDAVFGVIEDWNKYYHIIYQIVNSVENVEIQKKYALKAITIAETYLNNQEKLLNALTFYNDKWNDSYEILEKLHYQYQILNNKDKIFAIIKQKLNLVTTQDDKINLYNELTTLYIESNRYPEAFQNEKTKFLLTNDISILDNLTELSNELKNHDILANTFIEILKEISVLSLKEEIYNRVIKIYYNIGKLEESKELYFELIELKPNNLKYIDELIDVVTLLEDYKSLNKTYNMKLAFLSEPERITLLLEMASIAFEKLNQVEEAKSYLEKIIVLNPNNVKALNNLLFIYKDVKDYENWIRIALLKADLGLDNENIFDEVASVYKNNLNNIEQFIVFTKKSLDLNITSEKLLKIKDIFNQNKNILIADLLIEYYSKNNEFEEEKLLLNDLISLTLDKSLHIKYKIVLSDLLENHFNEYNLAYQYKKEVFLLDFSNNKLLNDLENISSKLNDFSDLISTLLKLKDSTTEKMGKINILARLGKIYDFYLKEHKKAQSFYSQILQEDSENIEVLTALEKIYYESQNYEMVLDILTKKHKLLKTTEDKTTNQITIAKVKGLFFNKLDEAMVDINRLLEVDDTIIEAYETKKLFFEKLNNIDGVIEVLYKLENLYKANEVKYFEIVQELANIFITVKDDSEKAVEHYIETHDVLYTLQKKARASVFEILDKNSEMLIEWKGQLTQFLISRNLWEDLIVLYNSLIKISVKEEEKENYYKEISVIYKNNLKNEIQNFEILFKILQFTKNDVQILEEIVLLSNNFVTYEELVEKLNKVALVKENNYLIFKQIAEIYKSNNNVDLSNIYYLKAFNSNPKENELFELTVNTFRTAENYSVLKDIFIWRSNVEEETEIKIELLTQSATILFDFLKDSNGAADIYEKIFELNKSKEIVGVLEEIYKNTEDFEKLINIYKKAVEICEIFDEKKVYYQKIITIFIEKTNQLVLAIPYIEEIISNEPQIAENYEMFENVLEKLNNFYKLDEIFQKEYDNISDTTRKEQVLYLKAVNAKQRLEDYDICIFALQTLLEANPYNEAGLKYLESLLSIEEAIIPAGKVLSNIYEILYKWENLVDVLILILNQNPEFKLETILKISNIYKDNLEKYEESLKYALMYFELNPSDENIVSNIENLCDITGKFISFIESVDKLIQKDIENDVKFNILKHKYRIAESYIENKQTVVDALSELSKIEPQNIEWYEKSAFYLKELKQFENLIVVLEKQAEIIQDTQEIINIYYNISEIYKNELKQIPQTITVYKKILSYDFNNTLIHDELENLLTNVKNDEIKLNCIEILEETYNQISNWDGYIEVLKKKLFHIKQDEARKEIYLKTANVLLNQLGDLDGGFNNLTQAFLVDFDKEITFKLFEVTENLGNYNELVSLMEDVISDIKDDELKQYIYLKSGYIYFDFIGDIEKSKKAFLKVNEYEKNIDILKKLEVVYQEQGKFKDLEYVYKNIVLLLETDDEKIDIYLKLAILQENELNNIKSTIETYNEVIKLKSNHIESLKSLERLNEKNEEELIRIYKLIIETELSNEEKVEYLFKLSFIYKKHNNDECEKLWLEILETGINKKDAYIELIIFYTNKNNWTELTNCYENYLLEFSSMLENSELIDVYEKLADIYFDEAKLYNIEKALSNYQNILGIEPSYLKALINSKFIYEKNEAKDELFEVIRQIITTLESAYEDLKANYTDSDILKYAKKLNINVKVSLLAYYDEFEKLLIDVQEYEEMIQISIRHLEIKPKYIDSILRLEEVYEKTGMFDELIYILEEKLSITTEIDNKIPIYKKMAETALDKINDSEKAISYYNEILKFDNKNVEIIEKLESIYEKLDQWDEVINILKLKIKAVEDIYSVYLKIIKIIMEYTGEYESGFNYISKLFELYPEDESILTLLNELGKLSMMWDKYIQTAKAMLNNVKLEKLRNDLLLNVAIVFRDELGDIDKSIVVFKELAKYLPEDKEVYINLENLYSQQENYKELAKVIEKIIEIETDDGNKKEYLYKLGVIYEESLNDSKGAANVYERIIKLYSDEMESLNNLERIYTDLGLMAQLVHVYQNKISIIDDISEKIELHEKIASIASEENNKSLTITTYQEILKLDVNYKNAFDILEEYYTNNNLFTELLSTINFLIENNCDYKTESMLKKASILEKQFKELDKTIEIYELVLKEFDLSNKEATRELSRIYKENKKWDELINLYKMILDNEGDAQVRIEYLNEVALTYLNEKGEFDNAKEYFDNVLIENSADKTAIDGLMKIYTHNQQWQESIDLLSSVAAVTDDTNQASECYYQMGLIYIEKIDDFDNAKLSFENSINSKYDNIDALLKLKEIAYKEEDYNGVVQHLEKLKDLIEETEQKISINNELGITYYKKLEEVGSSIDAFETSLNLKPNNIAAEYLSVLYFEAEMYDNLSSLYDNYNKYILTSELVPAYIHYYRNSFAKYELKQDVKTIFEYSYKSFVLNKVYKDNLTLITKIAFETKQYEVLISSAKQMLVHYFDDFEQQQLGDIYVKLGVSYAAMKDFEKSGLYFNRSLAIDEYNVDALKFAVDAYKRGAQWPKVIEYLNRLLKQSKNNDEIIKINYELGLIYKNELKNHKQALTYFIEIVNMGLKNSDILNNLYEIYSETGDYQNLIFVIDEKIKIENNQDAFVKYCYEIANLYYSKFNNIKQSLQYLLKILELNYKNSKVLTTIEQILQPAKGYKELEEIYTAILNKLSEKDVEFRVYLLEKLGIIYKDIFQDFVKATNVYELLFGLFPNNQNYYQILIDFYERIPQFYDKAILLHKKQIKQNYKASVDSIHALIRLYGEKKMYDRVLGYCASLFYLGKTTDDEKSFYESYRPVALNKFEQGLSKPIFEKYINHQNLTKELLQIFAGVSSLAADFYKVTGIFSKYTVKDIKGIDVKKDLIDPNTRFYKTAAYGMKALGLPNFDFYNLKSISGIKIENTHPQSVVTVGNDLLTDRDDPETAFYVGKHLFYMLPEFYLVPLSISKNINFSDLYQAVLSVSNPSIPVNGELNKLKAAISKNIPSDVALYLKSVPAVDIDQWLKAAELTANRVGLVLSGNVNSAIKVIKEDSTPYSRLTVNEKIDDILEYSVSETYFALREALHLTITIK